MYDNFFTLISSRLLVRNAVLNLIGNGTPMLFALIAIPNLISKLGVERFGVLTLVWVITGYFSIFDLGLSRAMTKLIAETLSQQEEKKTYIIIWTSLSMMFVLGLLGTLLILFIAPFLVNNLLNIPNDLKIETLYGIYILAVSIPIVVTTAGLIGMLQSQQRFELINIVRVPLGIYNYLAPLLVTYLNINNSLISVIIVLVMGRFIAWFIYLKFCNRIFSNLKNKYYFCVSYVKPLLTYGGWLTISNIISPIMLYLDRFLIGSIVSVREVAYYTTPFEIVSKLWIIPTSIMAVMFPAFCATLEDTKRIDMLYYQSRKYIFLVVFPIVITLIIFCKKFLIIWLGESFAMNSYKVMQYLSLGMLLSSLAQAPYGLIQAIGRPDITAKLHIIELPLYLIYFSILVSKYGINGAAISWFLRVTISYIILTILAKLLIKRFNTNYRIEGALYENPNN